jgi:2-keto-4-pentenoate hydratase/2-oxohepta-3-ene-1,7-dioic acid hydratase in catechol pathway
MSRAADVHEEWIERFDRGDPNIVCVGLNYRDHADEQGVEQPAHPLLFAKTSNTLCADGDEVVLPRLSTHVDAEAELAVVIGRRTHGVSPDDALDFVAGYTCANDVSARDIQFGDGQWFRGKSFDRFCPVGPKLVPVGELGSAGDLRIVQRVNGEPLQDSNTSQLIFGVRELIAFISDTMTLAPGDFILTGTPAGVGIFRDPPFALRDGDEVEVELEGIGTLRNRFVAAS